MSSELKIQSGDSLCASVNYKTSGTNKGICELNSKALDERESDMLLLDSTDFNHLHIDTRVRKYVLNKCGRILYFLTLFYTYFTCEKILSRGLEKYSI